MTSALQHLPYFDSPLARLDARWKLLAFCGCLIGVALLRVPTDAMVALVASTVLAVIGKLPFGWFRKRWLEALAFVLLLVIAAPFLVHDPSPLWQWGPISLSRSGLTLAVLLLCKALAMWTLVLVLLASTPINDLFKAAQALRFPGLLVMLTMLTYHYIFVLAAEFARIRIALRVRAYRQRANRHSYQTIGHVTGTLVVRGHGRAEAAIQAMRCRGFDGRFRAMTEPRTTLPDVVFFVVAVGVTLALLTCEFLAH
jgi:cobalt/nickel transport system permease protein